MIDNKTNFSNMFLHMGIVLMGLCVAGAILGGFSAFVYFTCLEWQNMDMINRALCVFAILFLLGVFSLLLGVALDCRTQWEKNK
jgi:hypothetical protein